MMKFVVGLVCGLVFAAGMGWALQPFPQESPGQALERMQQQQERFEQQQERQRSWMEDATRRSGPC